MSLEGDFDPSTSDAPNNPFRTLYKFARPHTIRGTILGSIAGTVRALLDTPSALVGVNWSSLLPRAGIGVVALLLGNTFITGINQIYDIEIDRLNKPFLPIASGEMNNKMAWLTVGTAGLVGPWIVCVFVVPSVALSHGPIVTISFPFCCSSSTWWDGAWARCTAFPR